MPRPPAASFNRVFLAVTFADMQERMICAQSLPGRGMDVVDLSDSQTRSRVPRLAVKVLGERENGERPTAGQGTRGLGSQRVQGGMLRALQSHEVESGS